MLQVNDNETPKSCSWCRCPKATMYITYIAIAMHVIYVILTV